MIVDCHCHAGTGEGLQPPWDTEARVEPHLERARAAGIDPERIGYRTVAELPGVSEKVVRDAGSIAVAEVPPPE